MRRSILPLPLLLLLVNAAGAAAQEIQLSALGALSGNQELRHPVGVRAALTLAPRAQASPRVWLEYLRNADTYVGTRCGYFEVIFGDWCPQELNRTRAHLLTVGAGVVLHGRSEARWSPYAEFGATRTKVLALEVTGETTGRLSHPTIESSGTILPNGVRMGLGVRRSGVLHPRLSAEAGYAFRFFSLGVQVSDGYAPFGDDTYIHELHVGGAWRL